MRLNENGTYTPKFSQSSDLELASAICPFTNIGPHEEALSHQLFESAPHSHSATGRYISTYAGHVQEGSYRESGSSGGMGSWLLAEALKTKLVDFVVNVRPSPTGGDGAPLFEYAVISSIEQLSGTGKSRYYPVEMSQLIRTINGTDAKFAVVAVPCFTKALRRASLQSEALKSRIVLMVGLVCGHLKTTGFAESLAWQTGVHPKDISSVDFRHKLSEGPASKYAFEVTDRSGKRRVSPMSSLLGRDWGMSFFKINACEFCDDVMAELADISIGDAWLPEYKQDSQGTNVVICRSPAATALVENGIAEGRLSLQPLPADRVAASQAAGLRHRREGLAYRLALTDKNGKWRPNKRVEASTDLSLLKKIVFRQRLLLMNASVLAHSQAMAANSLQLFLRRMKTPVAMYKLTYVAMRLLGEIRERLRLER